MDCYVTYSAEEMERRIVELRARSKQSLEEISQMWEQTAREHPELFGQAGQKSRQN